VKIETEYFTLGQNTSRKENIEIIKNINKNPKYVVLVGSPSDGLNHSRTEAMIIKDTGAIKKYKEKINPS
tara:strand:- start:57 stop:266 length:210 start_codon:yes stop_codon:yes gene_type:complete